MSRAISLACPSWLARRLIAAWMAAVTACGGPPAPPAPTPVAATANDIAPPFPHYVAAVLTEVSQSELVERLKALAPVPDDWTFVAHHITIAPPGDTAYRVLSADYPVPRGGAIAVRATEFARDDQALAVAVTTTPDAATLRITNAQPHITVAVAPGGKAFHSNAVLAQRPRQPIDPPLLLTARICVVSADSKTCLPDLPGLARDLRRFGVFLAPRDRLGPVLAARR